MEDIIRRSIETVLRSLEDIYDREELEYLRKLLEEEDLPTILSVPAILGELGYPHDKEWMRKSVEIARIVNNMNVIGLEPPRGLIKKKVRLKL